MDVFFIAYSTQSGPLSEPMADYATVAALADAESLKKPTENIWVLGSVSNHTRTVQRTTLIDVTPRADTGNVHRLTGRNDA